MPRACALILCLCLALAAPATAFADASARVLSVTPGVRYSLAGAGEALAVKMDVPIKAMVESDATGKAQLMFPDDSTLSIAPDTHISLAEYVDAEREENIVLDLVSGTARIITGESNRKNPQAFTVNTPQASIGIRGTLVTIQAGGGVTRVYLTETSGQGVTVRNLGTGQVMELRKPGTIINVGANFMEERKAQKEEAANFSAALRGKSRAEIERATARTAGEIYRAAAVRLQPEGTLPPASLGDPVQLAALTGADRLDHASLVSMVPDVPQTPEVPPLSPEPAQPNPDIDNYLMTEYAQIAGATFEGKGIFDYYENGAFQTTAKESWDIDFPGIQNCTISVNSIISTGEGAMGVAVPIRCDSEKYVYAHGVGINMIYHMDGSFTGEGIDPLNGEASIQGRITSAKTGMITKFTGTTIGDCGYLHQCQLKEPMDIKFAYWWNP